MIHELRLYDVAQGRIGAEVQRMYDVAIAGEDGSDGPSLFDQHGVPRPLFAWTLAAGHGLPGFGYIMKWPSIAERERCFPAFWSDPRWQAIKTRTDDGSPLVERIDDFYLKPNGSWKEAPAALPSSAVQDIILQPICQGQQALAATRMTQVDFPFLQARGGRPFGLFDITIGEGIPSMVAFVDWPDADTRQAAWQAHHDDAGITAARVEEEAICGRRLFLPARRLAVQACAFAPVPAEGLL